MKRVILEASGTLLKSQNFRIVLEWQRKVNKSCSVGMEKIRWGINTQRKNCKGYLQVLLVNTKNQLWKLNAYCRSLRRSCGERFFKVFSRSLMAPIRTSAV